MTELPSDDQPSRLDWSRVEAWAQQVACGDFSQINAVFETNGAAGPRALWRAQSRQIHTLQLRFLLEYWFALKGDAHLPRSESLDLRQIAPILGYEALIGVVEEGRDFRYRRCGRVLVGVAGSDMTGRLLSEHATSAYVIESFLAFYRAAYRRRDPLYTERVPVGATFTKSWHRLVLPLADGADKVDSFLVGTVPIGAEGLPIYMQV